MNKDRDALVNKLVVECSMIYARGEHKLPTTHYRDSERIINIVEQHRCNAALSEGQTEDEQTYTIQLKQEAVSRDEQRLRNAVLDEALEALNLAVMNMTDKEKRHRSIIEPLYKAIEAKKVN